MDNWALYRNKMQTITAILAFLTNSLLLQLIIYKSPKCLGSYKYLMIYISLFELGYAIIDILLHPEVMTKGTVWLVAFDSNNSKLPFSVLYVLLLLWSGSFGISLGNFAIHFIFRYLVVTGNTHWTSNCSYRIIIWLGSSAVFGACWTLATHYFERRQQEIDEFIREEVTMLHGVPIQEIVYFGFSFYRKTDGMTVLNWISAIGILLMTSLIIISSIIMFYFGIRCYLALKHLAIMTGKSSRSRSIQSQLFFALVFQTLIPMVLMHIPCSLVLLTTFICGTNEIYGTMLTVTIAIFPAIDPLPSILIIQPYRTAITGYFKFFGSRRPSQKLESRGQLTNRMETGITL